MQNTLFAFKVGSEWRLAVGSRTGKYVVCLDKRDADDRAMRVISICGGVVKFFEDDRPVKPFEISHSGSNPQQLQSDHPL